MTDTSKSQPPSAPAQPATPPMYQRTDTERLNWLVEHEAMIVFDRDGETCHVHWPYNPEDEEGEPVNQKGVFDSAREAIDAAMNEENNAPAAPAQPATPSPSWMDDSILICGKHSVVFTKQEDECFVCTNRKPALAESSSAKSEPLSVWIVEKRELGVIGAKWEPDLRTMPAERVADFPPHLFQPYKHARFEFRPSKYQRMEDKP